MRADGSIRVATWNLQEGASPRSSGPVAVNDLAAVVAALDLDFLALQEVPFENGDTSRMLDVLSEETGLLAATQLALSAGHHDSSRQSGLAILSTAEPVERSATIFDGEDLPGASDVFTKGVVACDFWVDEVLLRIASCHLFPFSRFSIDPATPALDHVWASLAAVFPPTSAGSAIVCGDFNTEKRELLFQQLSYPLSSTTLGRATHHGKSYDDLIHTPRVIRDGPPSILTLHSDHALCLAQFRIAP